MHLATRSTSTLLLFLLNLCHYSTAYAIAKQYEGNLNKTSHPLRVLIVGDSITHCNEGDYTWRYRIWQWFQIQNVTVDFVGPYTGTAEPDLPGPPTRPRLYGSPKETPPLRVNGKYAATFDSNHFAISGRAVAQVKDTIQPVVAEFGPDLVLVLLGFNDLAFAYGNVTQTLDNVHTLITNARNAHPETAFVVGNVIQRTWTGSGDLVRMTDEYNKLLRENAEDWSLKGSPVVWAPVREEYDCGPQYPDDGKGCPAAYDGLHPSELGEYQIARAFSRALVSGLRIGQTPLEVPKTIPPRSLPAPKGFEMYPSPLGITATWDKIFGAYTYDAEYRIQNGSVNPPLKFSPTNVRANRWDTRWATEGESYDLRVRPIAGNRKGEWTDWKTTVATPKLPPPPEDVVVEATPTGLNINWTIPASNYSADLFNVYYWDVDAKCTNMITAPTAAFEGTLGHIDELVVGHQYNLAIEAWNDQGPGLPKNIGSLVVGQLDRVAVPRDSECPPKSTGSPPGTDPINTDDPKPPTEAGGGR